MEAATRVHEEIHKSQPVIGNRKQTVTTGSHFPD